MNPSREEIRRHNLPLRRRALHKLQGQEPRVSGTAGHYWPR